MNCKEAFETRRCIDKKSDMSPFYVLDKVKTLLSELNVFSGRKSKSTYTSHFKEANENSTYLFKIYIRQFLCTRKII